MWPALRQGTLTLVLFLLIAVVISSCVHHAEAASPGTSSTPHQGHNLYALKGQWQRRAAVNTTAASQQCVNPFGHYGCCNQDEVFVTADGMACKDTVLELLELLRDRTLTIVGDSVSYQAFTALQYDINRHGITPQKHSTLTYLSVTDDYYQVSHDLTCNFNHHTGLNECKAAHSQKFVCNCTTIISTHVLAYNATVRYVNAWEFEPPETYIHVIEHELNPIKHALMEHLINTSDHIITNAGFHYTKKATFTFSAVVEYLTETLADDMAAHSFKRHFYWLSLPVHFPSPYTGLGVAYEQFNATHYKGHNHTACRRFTAHRHFTDRAAQGLIEGRLPMLDAFSIFWDRGNLHSRHKVMPWFPTDCLHYCYNPELFAALWKLFAQGLSAA